MQNLNRSQANFNSCIFAGEMANNIAEKGKKTSFLKNFGCSFLVVVDVE